MKTTLFNLHEIPTQSGGLIIEFYAGNIFDIYTDILLLSAFKNSHYPTPNTTWGELYNRTGINVGDDIGKYISENIIYFSTRRNDYFDQLFSIDLTTIRKRSAFTDATMLMRYKELANFIETYNNNDESISIPLLGTGKQGLSYESAIEGILNMCLSLNKTKIKTIRIFAYSFESIGILNRKINQMLSRHSIINNNLLSASIEEAKEMAKCAYSIASLKVLNDLISISTSNNASLNILGITGRRFAEKISSDFACIYGLEFLPNSTLELKIKELNMHIRNDRPYVFSYLRLLQSYGNQTAHYNPFELNNQDAAAIIIAIVRIIDFYESKLNLSITEH